MKYETRLLAEPMQVGRRETDGGKSEVIIEGYAARFDVWSEDLGGFRERIKPGAFTRALAASTIDVPALFNHDRNYVLGRRSSGTLHLHEDARGLFYRVKLPDTSFARDLATSMERGDIRHSSFAFTVSREGQEWSRDFSERTVNEVSNLYDVSVVTLAAYTDTNSGLVARAQHVEAASEVRSVMMAEQLKEDAGRARAWVAAHLKGEK